MRTIIAPLIIGYTNNELTDNTTNIFLVLLVIVSCLFGQLSEPNSVVCEVECGVELAHKHIT